VDELKVGIFVELYRPHLSGVVVAVEALAEQMLKQGHRVSIFAPKVPHYQDNQEVSVIRLPSFGLFGQRFALPLLSRNLIAQVRELHLDLIHIQGPYCTGILGIQLARKLRVPVVMTFHTHVLQYLRIWTKFWNLPISIIFQALALWSIHWTSHHCQLIIAPSQFIKNVLRGYGITTRIEVLPNGVRPPDFLPEVIRARSQLGLPQSRRILLYDGRIAEEKNLPMLIEAFRQVLARRTDVFLVLVGGGPYQSRLEQMINKEGLKGQVCLTGMVSHDQVWLYLAAADIFVFPSITETQGLSVSEAMSIGLPVVVVNEGGAADLIDNDQDGLVIPNNSRKFAQAILRLLENPGFGRFLGGNAQVKMRQLDPEIIYKKMIDYYGQVIDNFIL
jgi:glycosyltransferase involved in cell wall biosynthesis